MLNILKMIHTDLQTTTIHITHDRHEAWGIAQICVVMNNGRILQNGSVAELFHKPESLFVAEFLWTAKNSVRKIESDPTRCIHCGKCSEVCLVEAVKDGRIDLDECHFCMRCADSCPNGVFTIKDDWKRKCSDSKKPAS